VPTRAGSSPDLRSFDAALGALLEELRVRRYSASVARQSKRVLPRFFRFLRARRIRDLRAVSEADVVAYARQLQKDKAPTGAPLAAETQRAYLIQVRRLFAFLERRGAILQNPALDLVMPRVEKLPRVVLTQAQVRELVAAPSPHTPTGKRNRAILELLYGTGIRVTECARLETRDVDLAKGTLFIRLWKGKKDRVVPVLGRAAAALEHYLREARPELVREATQQAVFLSRIGGGALSAGAIELLVRDSAKAAGIPARVSPHALRHSFATHLIQGGADVRHVQELLGHASLSTTAIYTRVAAADLQSVIRKSHPRERTWRRRGKA
jgi:integrase/recombinase XerD